MLIKRGSEGRRSRSISSAFVVLFALLLLFLFVFSISGVSAQTGEECESNQVIAHCGGPGGASIYDTGYGAVELCQVCHQCGVSDGVCPEHYSDGRLETQSFKLVHKLRVKRSILDSSVYSVAFDNGKLACASLGGNCSAVNKSIVGPDGPWVAIPGYSADNFCSLNVSTDNAYYSASCINVPRKSGCENCPDVDCTTMMSGKTYDANTGVDLDNVSIGVQTQNTNIVVPPVNSFNGNYQMSVFSGYVTVSCQADGYNSYSRQQYLKPGRNIVDCIMNNLPCSAQCTTTDVDGNEICHASCDGQNSCVMSESAKVQCEGLVLGTTILINSTTFVNPSDGCTYENLTRLVCCTGTISNQIIPPVGGCGGSDPGINETTISGGTITGDVDNLLTRTYRKQINGLPVTLKIIVYTK
ncbi:MAG: hypothetical protein WC758_00990 [Candidatus Woesearchaeota archaeon]|jgi:hypothetical protein